LLQKICGSAGGLRVQRVGDIDEGPRFVDQESPLTGIIFPLGLLRQLNGASAISESAAGMVIDKAGHGNRIR
jgi:hypothetical protein